VQVNKYGAFMDWGLTKDLLVPFSEQQHRIKQGKWYVTYLFFDEKSGRLVGSTRIDHFLKSSDIQYTPGDEVDLLLYDQTALGYKVIINNKHQGLIFRNEVFKNLEPGYQARGFIKKVRDDGKIDVSLNRFGYRNIAPNTELIMKYLRGHDGYLDLNDNSKPEEIISRLEMSKKTFKKAIGDLYTRRLIRIERDGIYLI
jgi:predicted RNA-binding protein (virulence factor B family)